MRSCNLCTAKTECKTCKNDANHYLRFDLKGCVDHCSKDTSGTSVAYIAATKPGSVTATNYCMVNCKDSANTIDDLIDLSVVIELKYATACITKAACAIISNDGT